MKIIECVPNISEGKDQHTIDAVAAEVSKVSGVELLDVDPGSSTNRTVFTFAGEPQAVLEAAFQLIKKTAELVDMRKHKGEHARQGATDVCPFVPVANVTMEECVTLANQLGKRVGEELNIPVYLYAAAAKTAARTRMPDIREGEYEALEAKLKNPEWAPDYGPAKFNAKAGATVIGARNFLVAYNINLNSTNVKLAKDIALSIREKGRLKRDELGNKIVGADGKAERVDGLFKHVQATGWLIPEYNRAQITMNILDINETPLHLVYDKCCELANKLGCRVTGSEVVGMLPKKVLLDAGIYFLSKQQSTTGVSQEEIIRNAIMSLGLDDVAAFDPQQKIIELQFAKKAPLVAMTIKNFVNELASNSPAPGGGSVAALAGSLSAALTSMVAALTFGKKGYEDVNEQMQNIGNNAQRLQNTLLELIDEDTAAFNQLSEAFRMPKKTAAQEEARHIAIQNATKEATLVPLRTLESTSELLEIATAAANSGNQNSLSDAGVAGLMARACAWGAYYNVLINLADIEDASWQKKIKLEAEKIVQQTDKQAGDLQTSIKDKLTTS